MDKQKRKPFFVKGNFQIAFIIGFIMLLFIEITAAGLFIYRLSERAIEDTAFSSHLTIDRSAQIIRPIVIKANIYIMLISIFLACVVVAITYLKLHALFGKLIKGLENLKNNTGSFRINLRGGKNTREIIKEFNQAASYLDKHLGDLRLVLDSLLVEKELRHIAEFHDRLYSIIAGKDYE